MALTIFASIFSEVTSVMTSYCSCKTMLTVFQLKHLAHVPGFCNSFDFQASGMFATCMFVFGLAAEDAPSGLST
jgi:hypothetical protein